MDKLKRSDWITLFSIVVSAFGFFAIFAFSAYGAGPSSLPLGENLLWIRFLPQYALSE